MCYKQGLANRALICEFSKQHVTANRVLTKSSVPKLQVSLVNTTESISYVTGNSLENDSKNKTQKKCLDKEEVETNQQGCDRCTVYIQWIGKLMLAGV